MARATIMPVNKIPVRAMSTDNVLDKRVMGRISPYHTVVAVINAQYNASNRLHDSLCPTIMPSSDMLRASEINSGAAKLRP